MKISFKIGHSCHGAGHSYENTKTLMNKGAVIAVMAVIGTLLVVEIMSILLFLFCMWVFQFLPILLLILKKAMTAMTAMTEPVVSRFSAVIATGSLYGSYDRLGHTNKGEQNQW